MLCGVLDVLQATIQKGLPLDAFAFEPVSVTASGVDIGGCEIVEALVVAPGVFVIDEGRDLGLQVAEQIVVFQQDAVLVRLAPALDLALRHCVERGAPGVLNALPFEPLRQLARHVTRSIFGQEPTPMHDGDLIEPSRHMPGPNV